MPQTPTHMCTHHQQSWVSWSVRQADKCAQPGRCMTHSRLTLPGTLPSLALLQKPRRRRQIAANPPAPQTPRARISRDTCRQKLTASRPHAATPRTAMEQSGHAQVPTHLLALVRRQAGRAGWIAKIGSKNTENQKFETDRRYQFQGFAFQNILKGRLYLFIRQ